MRKNFRETKAALREHQCIALLQRRAMECSRAAAGSQAGDGMSDLWGIYS